MMPIAVSTLSPSPYIPSQPQPLTPTGQVTMGMMPSLHVPMDSMSMAPPPKQTWFSRFSGHYNGYNGSNEGHKRLIDGGEDPDSEARKELEIEQFQATRVHLIYSGVWFLSTTGLILALGLLGAQGWFPTFGYMAIFYNLLSFFLVWYDRCLEFRRSNIRVSEGIIFLYMWWAGFVGVWLALFCFNHKYQNVTFTAKAIACTILNLFWIAIYVNSLGLDASDDDGGGASDK